MFTQERLLQTAVPGDTDLCTKSAVNSAVPGDTDLDTKTAASGTAVPGDTDLYTETAVINGFFGDKVFCKNGRFRGGRSWRHRSLDGNVH